jgi:DNA-directed RNA polymerase specialized sigma subunit
MDKKPTDAKLIKRILRNNDSESLKELSTRHSNLCYKIYSKYSEKMKASGVNIEDFNNEIDFLVFKAAESFNCRKKSKFSTWLANCVKFYCLNSLNNNCFISINSDKIDSFIDYHSRDAYNKHQKTNDRNLLLGYIYNILGQIKDKRVTKIYKMRYDSTNQKCPTWIQIGKKIGLSSQACINLHNSVLPLLRRKANNPNSLDVV